MEKSISIYDLNQISENLPQISPAMVLVNVFMQLCDEHNRVDVKKTVLAEALGKSRRTISEWIRMLCKSGVIKYKYSGTARLNPFFYYNGTSANYAEAQKEWKEFKSDIKAL